MSVEYNKKAILLGSVPASIIMVFVFNLGISNNIKWFFLALAIAVSIAITFYFDKRKQNIFTSPLIVIIVSLVVYALKSLNFL